MGISWGVGREKRDGFVSHRATKVQSLVTKRNRSVPECPKGQPGGITVIDAKNYTGTVRTESRGGLFGPRTEHLVIGGRDQTRLIRGVQAPG
jgi:hypothetical protein